MAINNNLNLITSFGNNFVKINNTNKIVGNVWLLSDGIALPVSSKVNNVNSLSIKVLENFFKTYALPRDILLIGCGTQFVIPSFELRAFINKAGFSLEWMVTKSAIQTWNLLIEDYRNVLTLLLWE